MSYRLRLAHLYPEQMNIYGDRGNVLALMQRCAWRGITLEVVPVAVGSTIDWPAIDIAFFGGGQDSGQALIANDFVVHQGPALRRAIDNGLVLLAICGGYQLLGHYFLTHTGDQLPGAGALDLHTVGGTKRLIGNIVVEAHMATNDHQPYRRNMLPLDDQRPTTNDQRPTATTKDSSFVGGRSSPVRLVGFENHSGRTYLGSGVRPLGQVLAGYGNNGEDGSEGAIYRNSFGCYMHGSLLPKNPQFADHLIGLALARRYGPTAHVQPLDDTLELRAQRVMVERLLSK